jgi:hypothetical protein
VGLGGSVGSRGSTIAHKSSGRSGLFIGTFYHSFTRF